MEAGQKFSQIKGCFGSSVAFCVTFSLKPKRVASSWLHVAPLSGGARDVWDRGWSTRWEWRWSLRATTAIAKLGSRSTCKLVHACFTLLIESDDTDPDDRDVVAQVTEYLSPAPVVASHQLLWSSTCHPHLWMSTLQQHPKWLLLLPANAPRQPTLLTTPLTTTSTLPIWCSRNFLFLLLRIFRHLSLIHFLLEMNLMRPCTTESIRNRSSQGWRPSTELRIHLCKNRWSFRNFLRSLVDFLL